MSAPRLTQELVDWAELAGYAFTPEDHSDAALFWLDPGGEIRLYIRKSPDAFTLTKAERASEEQFELSADSLGVLERYLFGAFGWDLRSKRGLPRIKTPRKMDELAAGYRLDALDLEGFRRLLDSQGMAIATARGKVSSVTVLVELSHLLKASLDDLRASYEDANARPLFRV